MCRSTAMWWQEMKSDPEKLAAWLRRQYVGEMAAVNLLSELLIRFGSEMTNEEWYTTFKIMNQEALHGRWMKELMDSRGIKPEEDADATRRYWNEVLPAVDTFKRAAAAAFNAENMRLYRIREIANDVDAPADLREVFARILPHEEWHEVAFAKMKGDEDLSEAHSRGLAALNLVLA